MRTAQILARSLISGLSKKRSARSFTGEGKRMLLVRRVNRPSLLMNYSRAPTQCSRAAIRQSVSQVNRDVDDERVAKRDVEIFTSPSWRRR